MSIKNGRLKIAYSDRCDLNLRLTSGHCAKCGKRTTGARLGFQANLIYCEECRQSLDPKKPENHLFVRGGECQHAPNCIDPAYGLLKEVVSNNADCADHIVIEGRCTNCGTIMSGPKLRFELGVAYCSEPCGMELQESVFQRLNIAEA